VVLVLQSFLQGILQGVLPLWTQKPVVLHFRDFSELFEVKSCEEITFKFQYFDEKF